MFTVTSYTMAVIFCIVTMICWGSWGNTQKLVSNNWRYELFYWDYIIGMVLFTLILGFTMGSHGASGQSFAANLSQASLESLGWVALGGVIFNASNILLSASVSLAGMAVAFPLGVGIALVLGVILTYIQNASGNPLLLFLGVALIVVAIICNGIASGKMQSGEENSRNNRKGLIVAVIAGVLMSLFYYLVVKGMDVNHMTLTTANDITPGMLTPYSAIFIFSVGALLSNFIFNTIAMRKPFVGTPVSYAQYFRGTLGTHLSGVLGGCIWGLGTAFSYIASGVAGPAISYALGQGAPMIAALWGVFVWHEFRGARRPVPMLLAAMFALFIGGLALIVIAGN